MRRRIVAIALLFVFAFTQGIGLGMQPNSFAHTSPSVAVQYLDESGAHIAEFLPPSYAIPEKSGGVVQAGEAPILLEKPLLLEWQPALSAAGSVFTDQNQDWKSSLTCLLYPTHEFS